jgi:hypothetical protein
MPRQLCFGATVSVFILIMGCGTAPPESGDQSVSVNELRMILRESEQAQHQAVSKLQEDFKDIAGKFQVLQETHASKERQIDTKLQDFGLKFNELNQRLNMVIEQVSKLPIALKLQMRVPHRIEGTLEEAVAAISKWTTIPIRFEGRDLGEAGIPKIHQVDLAGGNAPAHKLLADALLQTNLYPVTSLADPQLNIVYVVQNLGDMGHESLVITSRKRAAERGKLPDEFIIKK